jgi:putative FmdB family regulatory protein
MPTYEYHCPDGHDFERFYRKMSDAQSEVACPVCGKIAERRMSAGAGLVFKGSGFYLTDYGKNAHRKGGDSSAAGGEAKGESKGESKTESKTESTGGSSSESKSSESSTKSESKPSDSKPASTPAPSTAKPNKSD